MLKKISYIFLLISNICISQNKIATANNNAVAILISKSDSIFNSHYEIASKLRKEKKTEEALTLYLQILETAKEQQNYTYLVKTNHIISYILRTTNYLRKALYYSHEALRYSILAKDTLNTIREKTALGKIHFKLYKKDSARYAKNLDSIELYGINSLTLAGTTNKYLKQKTSAYSLLSGFAFFKKDYALSEEYNLKTLAIDKQLKDTIGQINSLNGLASNFTNLKNYKKAKLYYNQALKLVKKSSSEKKIKYKSILFQNLAHVYYNLKDYKGYDYLLKANQLEDSIQGAMTDTIVAKIELKYNVAITKKEEEKKRLVEVEKTKTMQAWSIGLSLVLLITGGFFWNYSVGAKLKRKNISLEFSEAKLLKEKEIERLESDSQIKILNATLDGKEAERKQIAETLHDSVSALLSAANLHLQASKRQFNGKAPIEIDKTQLIIDEASVKIRKLSHELISSVLLKFGLSFAIQDFCEKYSNSKIEISSSTKNLTRYEQSFEIKINNIIEEFVNNILKHSNAAQAFVFVQERSDMLHIKIQDDGDGFDTKKTPKSDGIGINQIEARIKMMKGTLDLRSVIDEGTKIEIEVPVVYKAVS